MDFFSGAYQDETNCDGIGDIPHFIDINNQDNYPLMMPWGCRVAYESNTTITYATIKVNGMSFGTDGPDETVGYINVTIPIEFNSTAMSVC
ncbi:MAG: hypothetical protein PVH12_00460 [Candidatus Bathyarchaeota archaeon]|jgi:hypothetical protein